MPLVARTVGGPGSGKTYRALSLMEMCLDKFVRDPLRIAFVSFTRAARREASSRAAAKFNVTATELEKQGWFRTLHSVCYRQLGVAKDELLTGTKEDNEWLRNAIGDDSVRLGQRDSDDDGLCFLADTSEAGKALSIWETAKNKLVPLLDVWEKCERTDPKIPDIGICQSFATGYEESKLKEGRFDFCDLLLRFAGKRWTGDHNAPFEEVDPEGQVPILPVWIFDEAQDASPLAATVFQRLIQPSTYVYLMGDFLQSIYSFAGADGRIFADWPVAQEEELPVSYRCRQAILDHSLKVIRPQYKNSPRENFKSFHEEPGMVSRDGLKNALLSVNPKEDTLVLARTNEIARRVSRFLEDELIPWRPTKSGNGNAAPARAAGVAAILKLRKGERVSGTEIWRILQLLPSEIEFGNTTSEQFLMIFAAESEVTPRARLFRQGIKTWFDDKEQRERMVSCSLAESDQWGAMPVFQKIIESGEYKNFLEEPASKLAEAGEIHGVDTVVNPKVRIGTAHSSKGMEADHVVAINELPYPTLLAMEDEEGMAEERRVWYVASTRARHKLTIAEGDGEGFPDL